MTGKAFVNGKIYRKEAIFKSVWQLFSRILQFVNPACICGRIYKDICAYYRPISSRLLKTNRWRIIWKEKIKYSGDRTGMLCLQIL